MLTVLLAALCASAEPISEKNYRVFHGDGSPATLDDILNAAQNASVTFLGESHDDAVAHYLEAEILKRVAGPRWALSLEMFDRDIQGVVDEYLHDFIGEKDLISNGRAWSNYRTDYAPLVEIAKAHRMPVIAANAPRRYVDLVGRKGQGALLALGPDAKRALPPLPYAPPSEAYRERFERVMRNDGETNAPKHESKTPSNHAVSDNAMEAQSLWDAAMADSIAQYLNQHPGEHILQLNGDFHTEYRQGILERLERYRAATASVVVTILRDKSFPLWNNKTMQGAGDFVIVTDPHVRPSISTKK